MSVEFSNAYQEILFENLTAIIKQNFLFQTQLKMNDKVAEEKQQLQQQIDELVIQINDYVERQKMFDHYKMLVEQSANDVQERNRIQIALNESMQKNAEINYKIDLLNGELQNNKQLIDSLNKQIAELTESKKSIEIKANQYLSENEKLNKQILEAKAQNANKLKDSLVAKEKEQIEEKDVPTKKIEALTIKKPKVKTLIEEKESGFVATVKKTDDGSSF